MMDKKLIVVASLLLLTVLVIGGIVLYKYLTTLHSVLKVPAEAKGMDQYCAFASGKYTFLFAKDNVEKNERKATLLASVTLDLKTGKATASTRKTVAVVPTGTTPAEGVTEISLTRNTDAPFELKDNSMTFSRFACPGNYTEFDFSRKIDEAFLVGSETYRLHATDGFAKKTENSKQVNDSSKPRLKINLQKQLPDDKWDDLKTDCLVEVKEDKSTVITVEGTGDTSNCNVFQDIWGFHVETIKFVDKKFTITGAAIDHLNDPFGPTLCSDNLSIFPTAEGYQILHTDDDGNLKLYPAIKNFPFGDAFMRLEHKKLGLDVKVSSGGNKTGLRVFTVTKGTSTKSGWVDIRMGSCLVETAKMNALLNFAGALPRKECKADTELDYRSLVTRNKADPKNKVIDSIIAVDLNTHSLKIGQEKIFTYRKSDSLGFYNKPTGADKCN